MADLFACSRGKVVVMEGCGGVPGKIKLGRFNPVASIITSPSITQRVNVQFQSSLKESVSVYVFGDQMGSVTISGIAFNSRCQGGEESSGLKDIFQYYRDYRASQYAESIEIAFGQESISGFLTQSQLTSRDPNFLTLNFTFTFNTLPKKAS